ncbi:hypothetical protein ACEUAI_08495 [Aeromonas veronii]
MLGIYYNKIVSIPRSELTEGIISSLCFVITLNGKPDNYQISFEIFEKSTNESIFKSPDENLTIAGNGNYGLFAAKLGNIKLNSNHETDYVFNVKIQDGEYIFPFKLKEL